MFIGTAILILAGTGVFFAALACAYYWVLAGVAARQAFLSAGTGKKVPDIGGLRHRFAIVIPAHNEEDQLAAVLESCNALAYPRELFQVCVIADNCTDSTADVATQHGAACLVRHDLVRRGKGPALAWGLAHILPEKPDAVIVLDADCLLEAHALSTFAAHLRVGHRVLQAAYVASNPDDGVVAYVGSVANAIENDLFYAAKSNLGLAVLLRGTGMVFRRDVLEQYPWDADSVVEDSEYTIRLLRAGIGVKFVPEVRVWSAFPVRPDQMHIQRTRWVGGNARLALRQAGPLLYHGLRHGRLDIIDLVWTLFVAARSLVAVQLLLTVSLCLLACYLAPGDGSRFLLAAAVGIVGLHAIYFALGAWRLGLDRRRLRLLARAPGTVLRLLLTASTSLLPGRNQTWVRTPR